MKKVSVIIPTYNGGRYLGETLKSVFAQSYKSFDVLVVDDGSDQCLAEILNPYKDRLYYIYKTNTGPASTRNVGIKLSKGEYIAFLDHDDILHPDKLATQVEIMENHPACGLVYAWPRLINANGDLNPIKYQQYCPSGDVLKDFIKQNRIVSFSATLIRRSVFNKIGYLDESSEATTCDDYDMWLRIAARYDVMYSPGDLVYYRLHENNLAKNYEQNMNAHVHVLKKCLMDQSMISKLSDNKLHMLVDGNISRTWRKFAYIFYYEEDFNKAKSLLWKSLKNEFVCKDAVFFLICCLPYSIIYVIKKIKRLSRVDPADQQRTRR